MPRKDGSVDTYYIDLPPEIGEFTLTLPRAPEEYRETPATTLVATYLNVLDGLITEAKNEFT